MLLPLLLGLAAAGPAPQTTVPQLSVSGSGAIGQPLVYVASGLTSLPPLPEFLIFDVAVVNPPLPIGSFGDLYLAGTPVLFSLPGDGSFTWSVNVPNDAGLVGLTFHAQALGLVFDGIGGALKLSSLASVTVVANGPGASRMLAVANIGDGTIGFLGLNADGARHLGYAPTDSVPQALAAAPDGKHVYVADVAGGLVRSFAVDQDAGKWTELQAVPAGGGPSAVLVSIDGKNLYVANASSDDISQFSIDAQGLPHPLVPSVTLGGVRPTSLAAHPDGDWIFAAAATSGQVGAYAVNPSTGALTLSAVAVVGGNPAGMVVSPDGTRVHILRRSEGKLRTLAFDPFTGTFGSNVGPDVSVGSGVTSIAIDPSGRFVYLTDASTTSLEQYAIMASNGAPEATATSSTATGLGPVRVRVDPRGERAVVVCGADNQLWLFELDPISGVPTPMHHLVQRNVPADAVFLTGPDEIEYTSRLLLAGHRDSNEVRSYQLDAATGSLIDLGGGINATGGSPRGLALDRATGLALSANFTGNNLSAFDLNVDNGNLAQVGSTASVATPYDVAVEPSGRFAFASEAGGNSIAGFVTAFGTAPTLVGSTPMPASSVPRGIAVDPTGRFLVATASITSRVHTYRISAVDGALESIGAVEMSGAPWDVVAHPDGRFVYVLTRTAKRVKAIELDPVIGTPTVVVGVSPLVGDAPEAIAMDPLGRFLYVANSGSDNISAFEIDRETGGLVSIGTFAVADDPRGLAIDASGSVLVVANTAANILQVFGIDPVTGDLGIKMMIGSNGLGPLGLAVTTELD
ncbi:beta-propeller fold lactonase family protein [Engelhardtia mirabilis]|uniref:6-phosphogluconolactonase n=1 Tax=Engelhardtia mirabilis TaxID=2528011 RepID=A0A518BQ80_9BACT|nr:6-phosphogluconolactonase [Planctomycetes bacterium Pla133]QDV03462.1 6-phosphogluconolactonase [Planctomycetes bacterium Pla86]